MIFSSRNRLKIEIYAQTEKQCDVKVIDFPWTPLLAINVKWKIKRFQILFLFPITLKSGCKEGGRRMHLK